MYDNYLIDNIYLVIVGTLSAGLVVVYVITRYFSPPYTFDSPGHRLYDDKQELTVDNNSNHYTKGKLSNGNQIPRDLSDVSHVRQSEESDTETMVEPIVTKTIIPEQQYQLPLTPDSSEEEETKPDLDDLAIQLNELTTDLDDELAKLDELADVNSAEPLVSSQKISDFAAIILTDDDRKDFCEIVCITSGSDVIDAENLEPEFVLVDCRAPVLARRALIVYLYRKLIELITSDVPEEEQILTAIPASNRFELKKNFKFNLFLSEPPKTTSQPRVKGTVRLKSTIDKITVWNQVGIQGSLLTHFLDTIYINSVIIPYEFNEKSFHKNFVLNYTKEPELKKCHNSLIEDIRQRVDRVQIDWPGKVATNWIATEDSDDSLEMIDCSTGRVVPDLSTSRLSKHSLNACFRKVLSLHEQNLLLRPNQSALPMTYRKWKESAPNYRIQKQLLKVRYAVAGRQWTCLPAEVDMFV